jgi:outer membrane immunogenic protein
MGIAMRRSAIVLAATAAIGLGLTQTTFAAEMPLKAPAPVVIFSWTGCYLGGFGGVKIARVHEYDAFGDFAQYSGRGGLAGAEVGCQYQNGHWVVGVVADGAWTDATANGHAPNRLFHLKADEKWFGTARAKFGIALDRWWLYATGGWAWSEWTMRDTLSTTGVFIQDTNRSISGYVLGVGYDVAVTNNWLFNTEVLYINYGQNTWYNPPDTGSCGNTFACPRDMVHKNIVLKIGIKYLFNWAAPVVAARY